MPMDVEYCATCGCSEFDHIVRHADGDCGDECDEDCEVEHDEVVECGCGDCDDYTWMDEPTDVVCICGCVEDDHVETDDDDADDEAVECEGCGGCGRFEEAGTALERLRAELADRRTRWPEAVGHRLTGTRIRLDWLDDPVEVLGALVADADAEADAGVVRVSGVPDPEMRVFVYFAVTADGLEIAVAPTEIAD